MIKLVDKQGKEIKAGDEVMTFRGEHAKVISFTPPKHPASTGRIYVRIKGSEFAREFFPGVCDLEFINTGDV